MKVEVTHADDVEELLGALPHPAWRAEQHERGVTVIGENTAVPSEEAMHEFVACLRRWGAAHPKARILIG